MNQQSSSLSNPAFAAYATLAAQTIDEPVLSDNPHIKRYIWCASETIPHKEVAGGFINRCLVTPVLALPVWDKGEEVPDEMVVRYRNGGSEALYLIPPTPIFRTIIKEYGHWGVVELTSLRDMEPERVADLDIDNFVFPDGIPGTYSEITACLNKALKALGHDETSKVYRGCIADMQKSVNICQGFDVALVDEAEAAIERSKTDSKYAGMSTYDEFSMRALARLERERRDHALLHQADTQKEIVGALPDLIKGLAVGQANSTQALAEAIALAIRESQKPAPAKEAKESK